MGAFFMNDSKCKSPWSCPVSSTNQSFKSNMISDAKEFPMPYSSIFPQQMDPYGAGFSMFPYYGYDSTEAADRDASYMKQIYPAAVKKIQTYVEDECDKLEYDGSCMFDDCPDRVHLSVVTNVIYEKVKDLDFSNNQLTAESLQNNQRPCHGGNCGKPRPPRHPRPCGPGQHCPPPRPDYHHDGRPDWMKDLIEVLLFNEMNNRRRRYRGRKRWF